MPSVALVNLFLTGPRWARTKLLSRLQRLVARDLSVPAWETPRTACVTDVELSLTLVDAVREASGELNLDFAFMRPDVQLRDFRLLVVDMDSTLITIESIDEMADMIGLKAQVAAITAAAMRGDIISYQESLRQRVALLAGLDVSAMERVYEERLQLSPGAKTLIQAARGAGQKILLASGGFTFFSERLKNLLDLDFTCANTLEIEHGKLTGRLLGNVIDAGAKAHALEDVCRQLSISPSDAIVIGDGANDLTMMALGGMSVAYHAKPIVARQATHTIQFGGLDVILEWFQVGPSPSL